MSAIRTYTEKDTRVLVDVIRKSFKDVADRFGLTPANAPNHVSSFTKNRLIQDLERGLIYYILEDRGKIIGCVALEEGIGDTSYLERLAVLPECRRKGFGKILVKHVLSAARNRGASRVSIGIMAMHTELKDWYGKLGFVEGESKTFPHLPFAVTFMWYELNNAMI